MTVRAKKTPKHKDFTKNPMPESTLFWGPSTPEISLCSGCFSLWHVGKTQTGRNSKGARGGGAKNKSLRWISLGVFSRSLLVVFLWGKSSRRAVTSGSLVIQLRKSSVSKPPFRHSPIGAPLSCCLSTHKRPKVAATWSKNISRGSKLITDRHFFWGEVISNYRYRMALPEELISITETDLWDFQLKISHHWYRFSLEFQRMSNLVGKCSATRYSVAAPPPGARQSFGGPMHTRHPPAVAEREARQGPLGVGVAVTPLLHTENCGMSRDRGVATPWSAIGWGGL